ncbi:MAG: hypothetical protein ACO3GP_03260 [Candidatus Limnocylindrus sp.]
MSEATGADMFNWVQIKANDATDEFGALLPGLRAAVDTEGEIWAWCGLLIDRAIALMLASSDDEPFLIDGGTEYLRLSWMRENLAVDESGKQLAQTIEARVRRALFCQ